ncbi:MAG: V-type ATP synthase subunit E family protein [bacterium]
MSLDQVIGEVRRDGEARAQQILQDARKEAASILEAARRDAQAHEAAQIARAGREAQAVLAQAQSRAESESRKGLLSAEAELRDQMRAMILKGLADLPAKSREKHLQALVKRALTIIPKGTVWGAAADTATLAAQKSYKHGGSLPVAGGIVVESEDGRTRLDLTYETILDEAWRDVLKAEAGLFH